MHKTAFRGNIILPDDILQRGYVVAEGERILGVFARKDQFQNEGIKFIDYGEAYIVPGLVDLHLHGALGKDVMDNQEKSLRRIAEYQAKNGVTGFLGATISAPMDSVLETVNIIKHANMDLFPSELLGIYIEGPFLSPHKKGVHQASFIRGITEMDCERLVESTQGLKSILSLAPEVENNMRFIPLLNKNGFVVAIGHSNANFHQAVESFEKGVSLATHLFNAMSGFNHREPGVVGAVLDTENIMAELIADGIHVHPAALRLAVAKKGTKNICLVTDSIMASGVGNGVYHWGDNEIEVKNNKAAIRRSGVLAGSVLTLIRAVKNMIDWTDVTINQAINMASLNPARILGLENKIGSIQKGKLANVAVFDQEFQVLDTIFKGKSVKKKLGKNSARKPR